MKTRLKNKKETEYDKAQLALKKNELVENAITFSEEFWECGGKVLFDSATELRDKSWSYEREKENLRLTKVGDTWDYENKVCGEYRYRDMK
jgi:hypothetical protein|tara:strand:+ start:192 stop:464 length:273 start_codon:yes stop_codon:yes gene_type:complete